ncbi:hypothetical protein [Chitinolyticbacter meiyuanensis]|uniref:hypothetical protein n=1 Tax=Chitinolyticbacter meiyuanensis TaxID=682798 RepID=UPI0011E59D5A|nr:hypothetical protein [Chitinolyticbacter meiyuanensis]
MDAELESLADKIRQLVALCDRLKADNHGLRQEVLALEQHNQQLAAKVDGAKTKVAAILARLPEDGDEEDQP